MPVELTYADVEATLAGLNRIAPEKRVAFKARLKHFQRLGFPPGVNTGTGKRVAYTAQMLLMMAFATELSQSGMSPTHVVKILQANWHSLEFSLLAALSPKEVRDLWHPPIEDNDLVWMLSPEAMRDLSIEGEGEFDFYESIDVKTVSELPSELAAAEKQIPVLGEFYRHLIIRIRPFLHTVLHHLIKVRPDIEFKHVWYDLEAGLVERGREMQRVLDEIKLHGKKSLGNDPQA